MNNTDYQTLQKKSIALQEKIEKMNEIAVEEESAKECPKFAEKSSSLRTEIRNFLSLFAA